VVETDLETDIMNIMGSPVHLSKTIMNLVSNAAEAMPAGGVLFISAQNRYIDRPVNGDAEMKEGDYVIIKVSDTGVGISSDDMERIFEPFYTKKVMGRSGTGLGMAVVWGTVKDHKGFIDIQSIEGQGTTFTLYFPATKNELKISDSHNSLEDFMGHGESILVIDDVNQQREIATKMLNRLSYSVKSVSSGEEAVAYVKSNTVDLLLLDMIMDPGINGLETYKRIINLHPEQKAIIASGYAESTDVKITQKLGARVYLKKPYTLERLGKAVRNELNA
jgi:CheY-like chemotaxis protein